MDGLIIKSKWLRKILAIPQSDIQEILDISQSEAQKIPKPKTWEIRGSNTSKRGRICLCESGTGLVKGTTQLIDSIPLTKELFEENRDKHKIYSMSWEELTKIYKRPYAWIFDKSYALNNPQPYKHPQGAVIWVKDIES